MRTNNFLGILIIRKGLVDKLNLILWSFKMQIEEQILAPLPIPEKREFYESDTGMHKRLRMGIRAI